VAKTNGGGGPRRRRESSLPENRVDRWLAGSFVGILGLSVLCFILLLLAYGFHWFGTLLAPIYAAVIAAVVYFGLPLAIVLMIVLTIRLAIRRRRENKAS